MAFLGISIDVEFCTGCESCTIACQQEHGYNENQFGVIVHKVGPYQIGPKEWSYDFIPEFVRNWCDLCEDRVAKGKQPTCVQHCQAEAMEYGDIEELAKNAIREKQIIVALKEVK